MVQRLSLGIGRVESVPVGVVWITRSILWFGRLSHLRHATAWERGRERRYLWFYFAVDDFVSFNFVSVY